MYMALPTVYGFLPGVGNITPAGIAHGARSLGACTTRTGTLTDLIIQFATHIGLPMRPGFIILIEARL